MWAPSGYLVPTVSGTLGTVPTGTVPTDAAPKDPGQAVDGRSARWAGHRTARRAELVEATLRALRRHGAGVGIGEVAAVAGTSKTVLYRHFADREELYLAVCQRVAERLVDELRAAVGNARTPRGMLSGAIDAYLQLIERDPEVYRFVVRQPLERPIGRDPVAGL